MFHPCGEAEENLTRVEGDRSLFAFNEDYIANPDRSTLGLGFKDSFGELLTEFRPYQARVMPFFSNLLPEERMRVYLTDRACRSRVLATLARCDSSR